MISLVRKVGLVVCMSSGLMVGAHAVAPDFMEKLESEDRPLEDRQRDGARRPYQVMQLMGIEEGMTVVDIGAGGGWFTRVLSAAVGSDGKVISQAGPRALERNNGQAARDLAESLGNTEASFENVADMEADIADAAVTALNLHHSDEESGVRYLEEVYNILKPGGVIALIDHEGSEGGNNGQLHRMLASDARDWLEQAGFEMIEESDLLHTNADDHTLPVFAPELGRDTDQFLLIARKPE